MGNQLTAIDGFEITGYSQAVVRSIYYSQRFDLTNNFIHDNVCDRDMLVGAGFSFVNISGTISDNVFARNRCWRGGAGGLEDSVNENTVTVARNWVDANAGTEDGISHGGGFNLASNTLIVTANRFTANTVTGWGGGLYVYATAGGGQFVDAEISWNVYYDNRAGGAGGGFFCDDAATCRSDHELYDANCGGNIYLDSGSTPLDPTVATFDHLTNHRALDVDCLAPGIGVVISKANVATDDYRFTRSIFWGNGAGLDFLTNCDAGTCAGITVTVDESIVDTNYSSSGITVTFEPNNTLIDPRFVDPAARDFHLRSTFGHWTPTGFVPDADSSPALATANRGELGTYGSSVEASLTQ
jgi:hypothetical protein